MRVLLGLLLVLSTLAPAQEEPVPVPATPGEAAEDLERLRTVVPALTNAKEELQERREALEEADTESERAELEQRVDEQRLVVEQLRADFRSLASGVDEARYIGIEEDVGGGLQQSLETILEPISRGVREATAGPRELEELRRKLDEASERRRLAQGAVERLESLLEAAESDAVRAEIEATLSLWREREARASGQAQVFEQQVEMREEAERPALEKVSGFLADFWKSRGLNLVLAVLACVAAVLLVRWLYRWFKKVSPMHRKEGGLASRLSDVIVGLLSVVAGLAALIGVFYLRGDWLLLALVILALLGILWASKTAIPPYLDQIRMMLNVGPVREGERLVYEGVPWRVDRLHFYCQFRNPELGGGVLRLPIRDVMGLHSRPTDEHEPWFPCSRNDWVVLADGNYGKVIEQTPEQVVLLRLGGSRKTYPVADFLAASPENLAAGYRISTRFGIDYAHQPVSTTEVPGILRARVEEALHEAVGREAVRSVKAEFAAAGASSLDYEVIADFDGSVSSRKNVLERLLQAACVDACNENGWGIPFTQVTIHGAEALAAADGDGE